MVRHVFFSFHYDRDNWRAAKVRNSDVTQDLDIAGFVDSAEWEEIKRQTVSAIENWIDDQLNGTSVTAVLIGAKTYERDLIDYEIQESVSRKNGLVGIYIHNLQDRHNRADSKGENPLAKPKFEEDGRRLDQIYNTYDWKYDEGYENFGDWVEEAKRIADRR